MIALILDIVTSAFLFIWFTVGSIVALIALILKYSFVVQLGLFIAVSALFSIIGYPIVKKTIKKTVKKTPTMEESYIGEIIHVGKTIKDTETLKIGGIYWTVKNTGEILEKGDKAQIIGVEGNKIVIKKYEEGK
ncbi:hypothetical protein CLOACE_16900 [Clostridium acetireducens DSM 10703]|jgi:membrane protein implicated in regulation of membrane protease activity|uniref:NfeD-like C-terminal domain-containing protein n=1 Tax=Clostridium acetireducens DSM 10703 TaxID=1121290 RepID=A0A1E8EXG7_9CLOT|nr:NfeD family protein [Clostridium acetireducens]OFI05461.1 hypothetical protein CLOACE_16900 [Clostridium acetireducens DSM 10703]